MVVQDANHGINGSVCEVIGDVFVPFTDLILTMSAVSVSCNGVSDGIATVGVSGLFAPPLSYQWYDSNFQPITGATTPTAPGLVSGTYTVIVTDQNGCITSTNITISQPNAINLFQNFVDILYSKLYHFYGLATSKSFS